MKAKMIIIGFLIMGMSTKTLAQTEKYKALFMYKFLQGMEWPSGKMEGSYRVGVLGEDKVFEQLKAITNGRLVQGKKIDVVQYTPGSSTSGINMIFIGHRKKDLFESVYKEAVPNSTVVVTESPGLAKQGSFMNFITLQGKLKYEMNRASFASSSVKVNGMLESLAIMVD